MPNVADPVLRATSWVPNRHADFMQGEDRLDGKVIAVRGWTRRSDRAKLGMLRELAKRYGGDPHMRWFVVNNILKPAGVQQRDYPGQAAAMLKFVQDQIYYTNEPDEQVQSPWRTLKVKTGDCDDSALLLATFAEAIRLPWRYCLAGSKNGKMVRWCEGTRQPWGVSYAHIYVSMGWPPFKPTTWASAEQTVRGAPLGYDVAKDGIQRWNEVAGSGLPELGSKAPAGKAEKAHAGAAGQGMIAPGIVRGHSPVDSGYGSLQRHSTLGSALLSPLAEHWDEIIVGLTVAVVGGFLTNYLLDRTLRKRGF